LCNYAYSILRDSDEAEDMTQKVFCKLWEQRERIEIHTSVKSYLYRAVHNDCMNKIKQHSIRTEHNEYYIYEKDLISNEVENAVLVTELEQQIEIIIENMPPRCREVFKMSRQQQLSYSEIAQTLQITTNTVETQIVKALRMLRGGLKDYLIILTLLIILKWQ
jgi:RNA polymerase sigma-70 factor (ECF subfamily)